MKTAEAILSQKLRNHRDEYMTSLPLVYSPAIIEAMKEYASQAIDAMISDYERGDDFDIKVYAEKTKDELK